MHFKSHLKKNISVFLTHARRRAGRLGVGVVLFGLLFFPISARATDLPNLLNQRDLLNNQIKEYQRQANEKKQEADAIYAEIKGLNDNIAKTEAKIREIQVQIDQVGYEINLNEKEIAQKENELKIQKDYLDEALVQMYFLSNKSVMETILGSDSFSQIVTNNEYLDTLETQIETAISEIKKLKKELEDKKVELQGKKASLGTLQNEQTSYRQSLEFQKGQRQGAYNASTDAQKSFEQMAAEAKNKRAQVESQINSVGRSRTPTDGGVSNVGFSWPAQGRITQRFWDPWNFDGSVIHGGLDIANSQGTPIYAAADGDVIAGTNYDSEGNIIGYGHYVKILHNNRFMTVYGHFSAFSVSDGAYVKRGQQIGLMGSTGWSTGPHLHFEVREYGNKVDPEQYLP